MLDGKKIRRFVSGQRPFTVLILLTLLGFAAVPFLDSIGVSLGVGALFGITALLALALLTATLLLMNIGAVDTDGAEIARLLTRDRQAQVLIQRWIVRARWYRYVGGAAGLAFALGWTGHFVLFGMIGIMTGAVLSESARVGKPVDGPRTAELTRRSLRRYVSGGQQYVLYLIAGLGCGLTVFSLVDGGRGWSLYGSLSVLLLVGVVLIAQWRVVVRSRPALPEPLRHADDLLRYLANTRSLADPAMALGFALLAETFGIWAGPQGLTNVAGIAEFVCFVLALGVWWQNRRLGLDRLSDVELANPPSQGVAGSKDQTTVSSTHDS